MSGELVLVVCAANVCRSPFAELLLRNLLAGLPDVRIESAGTRVLGPSEVCDLVAARGDGEHWRRAALEHRARPVTEELLRQAVLVLVSDLQTRSEVVRTLPEVRDAVYTLRDAAFLADGFDPDEPTRRIGLAPRFAMHLDRTRALRDRPAMRWRPWRRRRDADWSSIEDGHGRSPRRHTAALDEVAEAVTSIATAMGASRRGRPSG